MKYQCIHSDTGLCMACFEFEALVADLKESEEKQ